MRIALLTDGIYPFVMGGMQKHSFYLTKFLARKGVKVQLYHCVPHGAESPKKLNGFSNSELKNIDSKCLSFPKPGKYPGHYFRESWSYSEDVYKRLYQELSAIDFVYVQGYSGWKLLKEKQAIKDCPPIAVNFHGLEMFQKAPSLLSLFTRPLFKKTVRENIRLADFAFSLGGKLTNILRNEGVKDERVVSIPIGIGEDWVVPYATMPEVVKFVFVGRYERRKAIEELNQAISRLDKLKFQFEFIGPIPENKQVKLKNVKYHGSIRDQDKIKEILVQSDVLVCPSYSEGMPTVIMEAMASGMAILASDVGAVCEQVNERNGILIRPGNVDDIEQGLKAFVQMDSTALLKLKEASLQKVQEHFLWNVVAQKTIDWIKSIGI